MLSNYLLDSESDGLAQGNNCKLVVGPGAIEKNKKLCVAAVWHQLFRLNTLMDVHLFFSCGDE